MLLERIIESTRTPIGLTQLVSSIITGICVITLLTAILINFLESKSKDKVRKEKKSIVETGTMMLFFIIFYFILKSSVGSFTLKPSIQITISSIGTLIMIIGCLVNIKGRLSLGGNWGNQIRLYKDHSLVTSGVFSIVRHPLYASLIWMFFGASLIYHNYLAALANLAIFIPFMYHRAKQEEKVLITQFKNYEDYSKSTGMFFPRLWKR